MDLKHGMPVLFVRDAQKSKTFYSNVLEMTIVGDFGGMNIIFKEGFALWQPMEQNIIPQKLGSENMFNTKATSRFELCFETEDLDTVYKKLKDNNVQFLHELNTELWGQRTIRFYDYDGHLLEVGEAMHVFLRRIFEEEGKNIEATAKRTFMEPEMVKQLLGL